MMLTDGRSAARSMCLCGGRTKAAEVVACMKTGRLTTLYDKLCISEDLLGKRLYCYGFGGCCAQIRDKLLREAQVFYKN